MQLKISDIKPSRVCLRPVNPKLVKAIMASIKVDGLRTPITVLHGIVKRVRDSDVPTFTLFAGLQRVTACVELGWTYIDATVIGDDEYGQQLEEIDANLLRGQLNEMERSEHFLFRRTIFRKLHPEAIVYGGDRKSWHFARSNGENDFKRNTMATLSVSRSTVEKVLRRAESIDPSVKNTLTGYPKIANNANDLDRLVGRSWDVQRQIMERIVDGTATSVYGALTAMVTR